MKEPPRLLAGGGSNLERRLLESAQFDRMPAASLAHLSRALGVPNAATAELATAAMAPRGAWAGLPMLVVTAVLLGGFAIEPQRRLAFTPPRDVAAAELAAVPADTLPAAAAPSPSGLPLVVASASTEAPERGSESAPRLARIVARSEHGARSKFTTPAPQGAAPTAGTSSISRAPASDSLGDELRNLEAIQRALSEGHAADAARALMDYRHRFGHGELGLEADLLEIDIEVARGQRERALAHARALLDRPEAAHYRQRLLAVGSESSPEQHH